MAFQHDAARHQPLLFVGRERELESLRPTLATALDGRCRVVLVSGEAGIGKTRLAEELAAAAGEHGARVFRGHCYAWEGVPAYWPWTEILRNYADVCDSELLRDELGHEASLIARIVPEINQILPDLPELPAMNPEQARFRLFDSVTRFLQRVASGQALMLILEDLHWADRSSLLLLEFIVRALDDVPLIIVGTYRNAEVGRAPSLRSTLATLSSSPTSQRLSLSGLDREGVARIIQQFTGMKPSERLVDAVHTKTEGNPFFVSEIARLMDGRTHSTDQARADAGLPVIPDAVRDVIGQRIDRLSRACKEMLLVAAVIGRDFELMLLERVTERTADELFEVLDEATEAGVITQGQRFGIFGFSHALIQETLYDELPASRRVRLHSESGIALEAIHAADLTSVYGDLARHFINAPIGENLTKAIDYAVKAGEQAVSRYSWENAVGHFRQAAELLEMQPDRDAARLCEVLLALGEAQRRAGVIHDQTNVGTSAETRVTLQRAAEVARGAGLDEHLARVALAFGGLAISSDSGGAEGLELLEEAVERLPDEDSILKARLLARLASGWLQRVIAAPDSPEIVSEQQILAWGDAAVSIARRLGDPATLGYALVLYPVQYFSFGPIDELRSQVAMTNEAYGLARQAGDQELAALALEEKYMLLLQQGDIAGAGQTGNELAQLAEQLRIPLMSWYVTSLRAGEALNEGRYDDAGRVIERLHTIQPDSLIGWRQRYTLCREARQTIPDEVVSILQADYMASPSAPQTLAFWLSCLLETEQLDTARALLENVDLKRFVELHRTKERIRPLTLFAEILAILQDRERAAIIYEALLPYRDQTISVGYHDQTGGSVSYYLGLLAMTLERWDDAERHFADALEMNTRWGWRPYSAYTRYAWADMLDRRGRPEDQDQVHELLRRARSTAKKIGMPRLLELLAALEARIGQPKGSDFPAGLTTREVEVLRLVAEGLTNPEVANRLFVSPRTVSTHLSSIYSKLAVSSRAAASRRAAELGII